MKNNLENVVNELRAIEPYWKRCFPCQNKGKCCVGADISASESEWNLIFDYIRTMNNQDKKALKDNIISNNHCVFRIEEKCLIHDVRPENCRYTPFQFAVTNTNHLLYTMVSDDCRFLSVDKKLNVTEADTLRNSKFYKLKNFEEETSFISLNYLLNHNLISPESLHNIQKLFDKMLLLLNQNV